MKPSEEPDYDESGSDIYMDTPQEQPQLHLTPQKNPLEESDSDSDSSLPPPLCDTSSDSCPEIEESDSEDKLSKLKRRKEERRLKVSKASFGRESIHKQQHTARKRNNPSMQTQMVAAGKATNPHLGADYLS